MHVIEFHRGEDSTRYPHNTCGSHQTFNQYGFDFTVLLGVDCLTGFIVHFEKPLAMTIRTFSYRLAACLLWVITEP